MSTSIDLSSLLAALPKLPSALYPSPMTLARLLPEVIDLVVENLASLVDFRALSRTSKHFHKLCQAATSRVLLTLCTRTYLTPEYLLLAAVKARSLATFARGSEENKSKVAIAVADGRDALLAAALKEHPLTIQDLKHMHRFEEKVLPVVKSLCSETDNGRRCINDSWRVFRISTCCYEIYYQLFHRTFETQLQRSLGTGSTIGYYFTADEIAEGFESKVRRNFFRGVLPAPFSGSLRALILIYRTFRTYSYSTKLFVPIGLTDEMTGDGMRTVAYAPYCSLSPTVGCVKQARRKNRDLKASLHLLAQEIPDGWIDMITDLLTRMPAVRQRLGDRQTAILSMDRMLPPH